MHLRQRTLALFKVTLFEHFLLCFNWLRISSGMKQEEDVKDFKSQVNDLFLIPFCQGLFYGFGEGIARFIVCRYFHGSVLYVPSSQLPTKLSMEGAAYDCEIPNSIDYTRLGLVANLRREDEPIIQSRHI